MIALSNEMTVKTPLEEVQEELARLSSEMKGLEAEAASLINRQRVCAANLNLAMRRQHLLLQAAERSVNK